jgi:hypothetical protein
MTLRLLLRLLMVLGALLASAAARAEQPGTFRFAAFGDTPYFAFEELRLEKLIEQINAEDLALVLHVGDIKSGRDRCDDKIYLKRKRLFDRFAHPFVLIPGDNDWTDCHRQADGGYDPAERLRHFRQVFYAQDPPLPIQRQSAELAFADYQENMRWAMGRVLFFTLHVVGSNDNFGRTLARGPAQGGSRGPAVSPGSLINLAAYSGAPSGKTASRSRSSAISRASSTIAMA